MDENLLEDIYDSLIGSLIPEAVVPWVEDAYAPGSKCDRLYGEMIEAYWRICDRLGKDGEDDDGEIMINNLLEIQRELCSGCSGWA